MLARDIVDRHEVERPLCARIEISVGQDFTAWRNGCPEQAASRCRTVAYFIRYVDLGISGWTSFVSSGWPGGNRHLVMDAAEARAMARPCHGRRQYRLRVDDASSSAH